MSDFSELLTAQSSAIANLWIQAVAQDQQIASANQLPRSAISDHIPVVLAALATVLAKSQESDVETIANASFQHGAVRAEQGFDPAEIVREYHLLREIILKHLQHELIESSAEEVLRVISLVNAVVDAAIAHCFKSYVNQRLQELEHLQTQLAMTNDELSRLVRSNQDNLTLLAHELKTPLTSIIGYSELFIRQNRQTTVRDSVHSLEHIERVMRSGRQLLRLINDALELARYEAGKLSLELSEIDVRLLIDSILETIQPLADSRGLTVIVSYDTAPETVITDSLRLQQSLSNLVSNAVRYTEHGSVTIACHTLSEQQWSITVTDTGIGIDPEDQAHIFEPFFRAYPDEKVRFPDSTGLGLAIVARLLTLLQGTISVTSQPGVGSTFTIVLPRQLAMPNATPP